MTVTPSSIVLITGATSGFGAAAALRFAADGARLVLAGRRADRLEAMKRELGVPVHAIALDVRDRAAVERAVAALPRDFAAIDVLVNNAGLALGIEPAQQTNLDDWEQMVDTNIKGLMYLTRTVLPGMVARRRGHVINIGSVAAHYPYPGGNVYAASKAFVAQFSLGLRADVQGANVRVTDIQPGLCQTEFSLVRFRGDAARAAKPYENTKYLTAEDVAECIHWAAALPDHININVLEVMPVTQAFGPLNIHREAP